MLDLGRSGGGDLVLREEGGRQIGSEGVEVGSCRVLSGGGEYLPARLTTHGSHSEGVRWRD